MMVQCQVVGGGLEDYRSLTVLYCATVHICWLHLEKLENSKQIKQARDLPGLSSSDSESESGSVSVSVVSGAKVTTFCCLTPGEGMAVTAVIKFYQPTTRYLYIRLAPSYDVRLMLLLSEVLSTPSGCFLPWISDLAEPSMLTVSVRSDFSCSSS